MLLFSITEDSLYMNTWDLTFYHLIAYAFKIIACISNLQRFEIMCPASFSLYCKNKKDLAFSPNLFQH